jgi:hypothetical protein
VDETHLVATADEVETMFFEEAGYYVRTEGERDATIVFSPPTYGSVGI